MKRSAKLKMAKNNNNPVKIQKKKDLPKTNYAALAKELVRKVLTR